MGTYRYARNLSKLKFNMIIFKAKNESVSSRICIRRVFCDSYLGLIIGFQLKDILNC